MTTFQPTLRHRLHRRAAREHRRQFDRWRKQQAEREYKHWLNHCGFGSADAYKESPRRYSYDGRRRRRRSVVSWVENEMRRHETYSEVLSQKKAHFRHRWRLSYHQEIIVI